MSDAEQERAAFAGQIIDLPVLDLLRTIVHGKKTGTARFDTSSGRGTVWFRDGEFIDADMGRYHLEDAIRHLLRVRDGIFEVEYKPISRQRLIKDPAATLLQPPEDETPPRGGGRRPRRAPRTWSPTGGGHGSYVGPLPTAPGTVAGAPQAIVTASSPVPISGPTVAIPASPSAPIAHSPLPPPPPHAEPSAAPQRTASTVFGLPMRPPGAAPPPASPPASAAHPYSDPDAPPAVGARATAAMTAIQSPDQLIARGHERGTPRARTEDDRSGPISVGTTWRAPARLASTGTQEMRSIESDARSTAGGVIQPGRGTSDRSMTGRPPTGETESVGEPRASSSAGMRLRAADAAQTEPPNQPLAPANPQSLVAGGSPFAAADSGTHNAPPAVVGRYEVLLRLARGGMGTVYLCRVTGEGGFRRLFALKVIREHLSRNSEYVDMLLQEARIASRLHHPNVVGIVDIGVLSGQHYLVMDYVEGCTFSELLKAHVKHRPPQLIVPIVLDALTGLHAAHTLQEDDGSPLTLVHCDFSPHNMLVGTNGICMISDFGIAKAADALNERSGVTRGKPAYLSPEQVLGERIDHRSDIFSAGVVLWNALTGEQLFGGDSVEQTMDQVLRRPIPAPSTTGLRPPRCFDEVCLKALERDPTRRYQSAQDMLIELRRVAITEDLLAPSTDISRWVTQTFGAQLDKRRQAAGITKPMRPSKSDLAIANLGNASQSATHALMQFDTTEPHPSESSGSRTVMLDAALSGGSRRVRRQSQQDLANQKLKTTIIGTATAMVAGLVLTAVLRPQWFGGGYVDEYGSYVDMPATFEIDVNPVLIKPTSQGIPKTPPKVPAAAETANGTKAAPSDVHQATEEATGEPPPSTDASAPTPESVPQTHEEIADTAPSGPAPARKTSPKHRERRAPTPPAATQPAAPTSTPSEASASSTPATPSDEDPPQATEEPLDGPELPAVDDEPEIEDEPGIEVPTAPS